MKRVMFVMLIAIVAVLNSCNKTSQNSAGTQAVSTGNLPLKASQYIDTNYPDAAILYVVTVTNSAANYIVTLNTTEELAFTTSGNFLGNGASNHGGHHGGDTIHHDSIRCDTIRGGHHGGGQHENGIPVSSLPSLIKDYISANYAAFTILHAESDTICPDGAVTEVVIGNAGQEPLKLYFDGSNAFLLKEVRILYADVPQVVKDYVAANYAAYSVCQRSSKLTMADNSMQYIIYMRSGKNRVTVRLMEDGTLNCIR